MQYGYFDDARREYVITRPDTPLPWINYLGLQGYHALISNTGGGYSFYRDARLRRILRYHYNQSPNDVGARFLYLRDDDTGEFWSPTWQPIRKPLLDYTCRHGLGYTVIASSYQRVRAEILYLVPLDESLEVWQVTLTNRNGKPVHLSVFAAVEFCLWDAQDDSTNFQRNWNTAEVEVEGGVIYHKTEYRERRNHFAYMACSEPVAAYDTQRDAFLGAYRGWENPRVVEQGACGNSTAHGWQPIGAQQFKLTLMPGESRQVVLQLGYHENPREAKFDPPGSQTISKGSVLPIIDRYRDPSRVTEAHDRLREYWDERLAQLQVRTPNEHTDRMVNVWNPYQCAVTFHLSRSASYFESGVGRGIGFRDSNQDLLAFVQLDPERARQRLLDLASTQLESGGAYHQYQPLTGRGNNLIGSNFNDDPLWLILAAAAYLKETGDGAALVERVPYDNQPGTETPLYEHLQRSIRYTLERLGPHGLPLIGRADWNDCLNLNCFSDTPGESFQTTTSKDGRVAESVMLAGLFACAARELAGIARWCGYLKDATEYAAAADQMQATISQHGWDGEWFLRAYDDNGCKVGSRECTEGQILLEPQGWCIMAGVGLEDGRAEQALDSVDRRLATEHGLALLTPAYSRYHLELGEISSYPPGYKENGSIFCHANPWVMIAAAMAGRGDQAFDYYFRINPSARESISNIHRSEPFVYAQTIAGPEAPTFGEAKNSWLTGTAAWNYVAITQWIFGIRPTLEGLQIAPVIPRDWPGFHLTRVLRGVSFDIEVERRGPGHRVALVVDGVPVQGDTIPLPQEPRDGARVKVKATLL